MVAHLCCSVDALYFLKRLKEDIDEEIIGYFYDPNIHPYSEFKLRSLDAKRACEIVGVKFVEGDYDFETWYKMTKGYEKEPEKGSRCEICFSLSLKKSAEFAKKIGKKSITTSLLLSPKKSISQIQKVAKEIEKEYGVNVFIKDYKKKGGTQKQQQLAKENQLYRQDYCGCFYALLNQKEFSDELISPYPFQILPASIEEKIEVYKNIKNAKVIKEGFLNYRILSGKVEVKKAVLDSYVVFYSYLKNGYARCYIDKSIDGIYYANRKEIIFIDLKKLNALLNKNYKSIKELYKRPLNIDEEIYLREKITHSKYSLTPIIILDEVKDLKYDIKIEAKIYPDVREILIKF
jgi:predicted adenine nucleotide alpha hydrolase (AANH) superfamily ATPase